MIRHKREGFTLVELVVVMAVIAILAAVIVPTFTTVIDSANKSAAEQEAGNLRIGIMTEYKGTFDDYCNDYQTEQEGVEVTEFILRQLKDQSAPGSEVKFEDFLSDVDGKITIKAKDEADAYIEYKTSKGYTVKITATKTEAVKD